MEHDGYFTQEFKDAIVVAGNRARLETLQASIPVFYWDRKNNLVSSPALRAQATTA